MNKPTLRLNKNMISAAVALGLGYGAVAHAQEQTWSYTYNDMGLKETADGPRTDVQDVTTYTYDDQGNLETVTQPLGYVTTYNAYDAAGRVLSVTDPSGLTTEFTYHPRGWLTQSVIKDRNGDVSKDRITDYEYYADGELKRISLPNGAELQFEYNGANHLTAITNSAGERIEYELDAAGNRTREDIKSADGTIVYSVEKAYDELSRLMDVFGNNGQNTHIDYDANDNPVYTTDALAHTSEQEYDALNRVKKQIDPLAAQTNYEYDAQGNISQVTDAKGNTTYYTYDGLGNLLTLDSPDTGITTYTYDNAGNRISETDARGVVTEYQYDALNRLVKVSYPASPIENVTYEYCAVDEQCLPHHVRLIETADGYSQMYVYTAFNELRFTFSNHDGGYAGNFYTYDERGNIIRYALSGNRQMHYTWDNEGRIVKIETRANANEPLQTVVGNVTYMSFGAEKSYTYGNGLTHNLEYNLDYQIERIQVGGINTILDYDYDHNVVDNIVGIDNVLDPNRSQTFTFDPVSRLVNAQGIYGDIEYQYDAVGNRLKRILNRPAGQATEFYGYHSGTNQISYMIRSLASGGYESLKSYEYDAAGNPVIVQEANPGTSAGSNWVWVVSDTAYNDANRRSSLSRDGQLIAEYQYNPLGQRIAKTIGGVTTERYLYDPSGKLVQVSDGQHTPLREYIYLNGKLVSMINSAEANKPLYYVHHDHLGTPHKLTNQDQQVVWSADYLPFGEAMVSGDQEVYSRFPGQYYDEESGLYYNYFRDYDPELGRYIQSDPIGLGGGVNTYGYALQNPLSFSDPLGLKVVGEWVVAPDVHGLSLDVSPAGFTLSDGKIYLDVVVSGAGQFTFKIRCTDTCTNETWDKGLDLSIEATRQASAPLPGMCGAIAAAARYSGRNGNSVGRRRAGSRLAVICAGVTAINAAKVAKAAEKEVNEVIDLQSLKLIKHYLDLGADAICQQSRS